LGFDVRWQLDPILPVAGQKVPPDEVVAALIEAARAALPSPRAAQDTKSPPRRHYTVKS